jgi:hypothetical protein
MHPYQTYDFSQGITIKRMTFHVTTIKRMPFLNNPAARPI